MKFSTVIVQKNMASRQLLLASGKRFSVITKDAEYKGVLINWNIESGVLTYVVIQTGFACRHLLFGSDILNIREEF